MAPEMKIGFLVLAAFLWTACAGKPDVVEPSAGGTTGGTTGATHRIFVTGHGWHTGIVVPAAAINRELPFLRQRFGDVPFYEFGWGDRGFYEAEDITLGLALQAVFWPTETVMHVVAVPGSPRRYFPNSDVVALSITGRQFAALRRFIANGFYRDDDAKTVAFRKGLYGDAQFYKGVGTYYLLNTCNTWTAKGLRSAGVDISPAFKLTAGSVLDSLPNR